MRMYIIYPNPWKKASYRYKNTSYKRKKHIDTLINHFFFENNSTLPTLHSSRKASNNRKKSSHTRKARHTSTPSIRKHATKRTGKR